MLTMDERINNAFVMFWESLPKEAFKKEMLISFREACVIHIINNPSQGPEDYASNLCLTNQVAVEPKKKKKVFKKPTLSEVQGYFYDRGHQKCIDAGEAFIDHYESNGWKIGGKGPMKCWKAAVRNWMRNNINQKAAKNDRQAASNSDDWAAYTP